MGKIGSYARQTVGYRAARNGAYRENDIHHGLSFERGAAAKNPSGG